MSFKETICYIAVCDTCDEEAEYEEYSGYATKKDAVACADGWIETDGKLTCADCRFCERCGAKGGLPGDHGFLCDSCSGRVCGSCGHRLRLHYTATPYSPGHCVGVVPDGDTTTIEFCGCADFAEASK